MTSPSQPRTGAAAARWLPVVAMLLAALFLWRSWGRWADVLVDFGRELYVPWRLVEGERLGADLAWFNGPLSPHVNALLFGSFGVGYWTLAVANLLWLALVCVALHRTLARLASPFAAGVALCFFLAVFAFGHLVPIGNYNFVSPYSHELTHGIGLALLALCLLGGARDPALRRAGILLGLVFLTKPELFVAALLGCGVLVVLRSTSGRERSLLRLAGWTALVPLLAVAWFAWRGSFESALGLVLGPWGRLGDERLTELAYYERGLGLDDPAGHLLAMLRGLGLLALATLPGCLLARLPAARRRARAAVALAFVVALGVWILVPTSFRWLARATPAVIAFALVVAALRLRRAEGEERHRLAELLGFGVFALALLAKILLQVRFGHYGFALAAPASCLVVVLLLVHVPRWLAGEAREGAPVAAAPVLALVLVCAATQWLRSDAHYRTKEVPVGEGRDAMLADARGEYVARALEELERRLSPEDELVVLPEGVMLNYLARRRTPTPYVNFMPPEMILFGEAEILAALERDPPAAVLLVHKDTSEYGVPLFGTDYAASIGAWVLREYRHLWTDPRGGAPLMPGTEFGIALLERRP